MTELAARVGVHKSTASRLAATLAARGFLERPAGSEAFRLGPELGRLGLLALGGRELVELSRPAMERLAADTGETVNLAVLDGEEAVNVAQVEGRHIVGVGSWTGRRTALHCTANGKVLLAFSRTRAAASTVRGVHTEDDHRPLAAGARARRGASAWPRPGGRRAGGGPPRRRGARSRRRRTLPRGAQPLGPLVPDAGGAPARARRVLPRSRHRRSAGCSRETHVRLELASYPVELSTSTRLPGSLVFDDPRIAGVEMDVVRPGEPVRLTHVLDAVEPRVKPDDPESTFPGALGALRPAGEGRTNRIAGAAVVACADFPAEERPLHEQEALIDMAGPGSALLAALADGERRPDVLAGRGGRERRLRGGGTDVEAAGCPRSGGDDDRPRAFRGGDVRLHPRRHARHRPAGRRTPAPALLARPALRDLPLRNDSRRLPAIAARPARGLDGALTAGEYHWAGLRNCTYSFQNSELVRELLAADGQRLRFAGLVACRGYNQTAVDKERAAMLAAKVARELGADGALVTTDAGGNSHTDTMLTVRACEQAGIRAVALVAEMGGLTDHVPEADAIVSVGNAEELVPRVAPRTRRRRRHPPRRPAGRETPVPSPCATTSARPARWATWICGRSPREGRPLPQSVLCRDGRRGGSRLAAGAARGCGRTREGARAARRADRRHARLRRRRVRRARGSRAGRPAALARRGAARRARLRPLVRIRPLRLRVRAARPRSGKLGIPAVCGMDLESPGVAAAEGAAYVVPTSSNVAGMREALPTIAALALRLGAGEELGPPRCRGLPPARASPQRTGGRRPVQRGRSSLLLDKLAGTTRTEVAATFDHVAPPPPVESMAETKLALVTEAGCVPAGKPGRLADDPRGRRGSATRSARRIVRGRPLRIGSRRLRRDRRQSRSRTGSSRSTPPEPSSSEGRIGAIHDAFYTTTGNGTPVAVSTKFGQEIADELKEAGVEAVILSGT